jgi:hypothetical protein
MVEWKLIHYPLVNNVNSLYTKHFGVKCVKDRPYAICDLRPMMGEVYSSVIEDYDWWGWCDLDIVTGDLDKLLEPMLHTHDVISSESYVLNGAMTLLRNTEQCNSLFRKGDWVRVLGTCRYTNFDEGGLAPERPPRGFTGVVNSSDLRVHYDDRSWHEGRSMIHGFPSRICNLRGNSLIELPTEREIILYHLGSKRWPDLQKRWEPPPPLPSPPPPPMTLFSRWYGKNT